MPPLMMTINEKENNEIGKVSINWNQENSLNLVMTCQLFKH